MAEITYQMILSTIQTIALVVGIIYYLTIMRNSQKNQELARKAQEQALETRETQLFMNLYNRFQDNFIKTYYEILDLEFTTFEEFLKAVDEKGEDFLIRYQNMCAFYEGVGVLVREGKLHSLGCFTTFSSY